MNLSGQQQQAVEYLDSPTLVVARGRIRKNPNLNRQNRASDCVRHSIGPHSGHYVYHKAAEEMKSGWWN